MKWTLFQRLIKDICHSNEVNRWRHPVHWQASAIGAIHEAIEAFLCRQFESKLLNLYFESTLILISVALYCALHAKRVKLQVNDMRLVDTLQIFMGGSSYNEESRLAQVAKMDAKVDFSWIIIPLFVFIVG